ncbi:MAG: sce7726 family protein [Opitutales bacterium]|nr:sce7726 family protein [Opitutales bacterium]
MREERFDANYIKTTLIDFLLKEGGYDLIANEVPFLQENRWADLIAIKEKTLIGFEVKSKLDSLKTLSEQIQDYSIVFNKVYLVLAEKFIDSSEVKNLPKSIGIIKFIEKEKKVELLRKPKSKIRLNKEALLSFLWRKDLEILLRKKQTREELDKLAIRKLSLKKIQNYVLKSLISRYGKSYQQFLRDCQNNYTTIEDIKTITKLRNDYLF